MGRPPSVKKRANSERVEPEGLTQQQVADLVGCAQSTVSKAIKRGDIETLANGRLPESSVEAIRALWRDDQKANEETAALERRLKIAETEKEEANARLKTMQAERESGAYVKLEDVARDAADAAERVLAILRAVPQRTAMALECSCQRAAQVEAKIGAEIERAVAELRESLYVKGGE